MKTTSLIATTMFAVTSAFTPATRVAFKTVGARAFSRSSEIFANPKGESRFSLAVLALTLLLQFLPCQ